MSNSWLVSIISPCRNEERFIGKCLDSLIANDYPKDKMEVLVVDGMSEDGTRKVIGEYTKKYLFIKVLDNPKKISPCALNIGIKNAKGEIILIMDAHAACQNNYISRCVKYLYEYNVDNVGGTMVTLPKTEGFMGKAIVKVLTSCFGVGNADFRTGVNQPKETDTVFGGCYRREVFDKIGYFNENLVSSQDMDFNIRLKKQGGKIMLFPDIISYYYTRSDFKSFCKNNFRNGFWAIYPMKFVKNMPVSIRHLVPLLFILSLMFSLLFSFFFHPASRLFLFIIISYAVANIYFSTKIALQQKNLTYLLLMPTVFASLHFGYGLGSVLGLGKCVISKQFWKNLRSILKNRGMQNSCQRS